MFRHRSDEPTSITDGIADNSHDGQLDSNEDGDKQVWPLFRGNSVFVFNSQKDNVKGVGAMEKKKSKSVAGAKQSNRRKMKRVEISNNSITNYFTGSSSNQTKLSSSRS